TATSPATFQSVRSSLLLSYFNDPEIIEGGVEHLYRRIFRYKAVAKGYYAAGFQQVAHHHCAGACTFHIICHSFEFGQRDSNRPPFVIRVEFLVGSSFPGLEAVGVVFAEPQYVYAGGPG